MFCCKKRKARKSAKAQAIVSSLATAEAALDSKTAELFAEKLTGDEKALKKARKATAKTVRAAEKELARIERNGGKRPRKGLAFLGLVVALAITGAAAYNAARPVEDPWKNA